MLFNLLVLDAIACLLQIYLVQVPHIGIFLLECLLLIVEIHLALTPDKKHGVECGVEILDLDGLSLVLVNHETIRKCLQDVALLLYQPSDLQLVLENLLG